MLPIPSPAPRLTLGQTMRPVNGCMVFGKGSSRSPAPGLCSFHLADKRLIDELLSIDLALKVHSLPSEYSPYSLDGKESLDLGRHLRSDCSSKWDILSRCPDLFRPYTIPEAERLHPRSFRSRNYEFYYALSYDPPSSDLGGFFASRLDLPERLVPSVKLPCASEIMTSPCRRLMSGDGSPIRIALFDLLESAILSVAALRRCGMPAYPVLIDDPIDSRISPWPAIAIIDPASDHPFSLRFLCHAGRGFDSIHLLSDEVMEATLHGLSAVNCARRLTGDLMIRAAQGIGIQQSLVSSGSDRIAERLAEMHLMWPDSPLLPEFLCSLRNLAMDCAQTLGHMDSRKMKLPSSKSENQAREEAARGFADILVSTVEGKASSLLEASLARFQQAEDKRIRRVGS